MNFVNETENNDYERPDFTIQGILALAVLSVKRIDISQAKTDVKIVILFLSEGVLYPALVCWPPLH